MSIKLRMSLHAWLVANKLASDHDFHDVVVTGNFLAIYSTVSQ